jgi:Glycosyl hydrolases family 2, TIM barrel domain
MLICLLCATPPVSAQLSSTQGSPDVRTGQRQFLIDGRPFVVRGIHYGPWRPGTGPNKEYPYPALQEIAADFDIIRRTHANTVLVYDSPPEVLDLADRYGFKVIYVFALDWYAVGGAGQSALTAGIRDRVSSLRSKRALLAWVLGNEVPGQVLNSRGEAPIIAGLHELYSAVKAVDPSHPVSHANWPPGRHLDLRFMDFACFNVYPLWPPEVAAMGFGRFIETVLQPIAENKPLLISEFGANTIEAGEEGQARLVRNSWHDLIRAGAAGGVVFEFADEWWKNYDNPARPGDWWTRLPAPDDELRQDNDPEESYGLVRADRTPKLALNAVAEMFSENDERTAARRIGTAALSSMVLAAATAWVWARRRSGARGGGSKANRR